ncbi:unnamed protein product, partial [Candidula unifasciata]
VKAYMAVSLLLVCYGTETESLECFQCEATSETGNCITDWEVMSNSTTRQIYAKNCTHSNVNWTRCMIQRVEVKAQVVFFHRACDDGSYFEKHLYSPRFEHLPPDNQTTCDVVGDIGTAVCYTPCDTDFCNGPQLIPEKNCTDSDTEGCRAPGIFLKTQLVLVELVSLISSLLLVPWFLFHRP